MDNVIVVNNVSYSAGTQTLLKDINLKFSSGEITALLGSNGAGKSTLLKLLSNSIQPNQGNILFNNENICDYSSSDLAKLRAFMSQNHTINFPFKVREIVEMGRYQYDYLETKMNNDIIDIILDELDLIELQNNEFEKLSGGEKQRVHLARVVAQLWPDNYVTEPNKLRKDYLNNFDENTTKQANNKHHKKDENSVVFKKKVLLLDEPTSAQDLKYQHHIFKFIKKITKMFDITTIAIIHDINLAKRYSNNVVLLKGGKVYDDGNVDEILNIDNIYKVFDVDRELVTF